MLHDLELYKEFYEQANRGKAQWQLIFSDDPAEIKKLEAILEMTQADAVNDFIETSCWKDDLPDMAGNKGTADERLHRLRFAYLLQHSRLVMYTDYHLLTPLEHKLFDLVWDMEKTCTDETLKKRAKFAMGDATRVADRAKRRWWKEMEDWRKREDVPFEAVIGATDAKTLEEFVDYFVAKDSPEIAEALRQGLAARKKKKAKGKRVKKLGRRT